MTAVEGAIRLAGAGTGKARRHERTGRSAWRAIAVRSAVPVYLALISGGPVLVATLPVLLAKTIVAKALSLVIAPMAFVVSYVTIAGGLSRITRYALVAGKFPRDLGHAVYGPRRLHALCWTAVYYCTPVYHAVLAVPALKQLTFRLFGYRGSLDVTLYPDTWVRDLPVLEVGKGAYLSNRATIGTNMCLTSGDVIVAPVRIGDSVMVGHLAMVAPGVVLEERVEVGVGAGIGMRVHVGASTRIGPCVVVHHGATIGSRCDIGARSYIGTKAVISDGVTVPAGSVVPARSVIRSSADLSLACPPARLPA